MSSSQSNPSHVEESISNERPDRLYEDPPYKPCNYEMCEYTHTQPLAELFQIRIDKFDEMQGQGEVYGIVEVVDLEEQHTLYRRDLGNPEKVCANSSISLGGPPRTISIITGVSVTIELRRCTDCGGGSDSEDVILGSWQLSWDFYEPQFARIARGRFFNDFCDQDDLLWLDANVDYQEAGYDRPLCAKFEGYNGSCITMYYGIFLHAAQVWVQVEIVNMNGLGGNVKYNVRGNITATCSHFEFGNDSEHKDSCKSMLLETKNGDTVKAERWKKIQLSRSYVAVPAYARLIIEADLWDSSQLKIAQGKLKFNPSNFELSYDYIRGDDDSALRVMVAWSYGSTYPRRNPFA